MPSIVLFERVKKIMKNRNNTKVCAFYASDYHFEMMTLPYIEKNVAQGKNVIIFTENDLSKTMNVLLSNLNLNENKKRKIAEINWKNQDNKKIKDIEELKLENKDAIVFIKGNENYIKETNEKIKPILDNGMFNIIDCYNIEELENVIEVEEKYNKILNTTGIVDIN